MTQPAGWYDDPQDSNTLRYWDGVQWTQHTSPRQRSTGGSAAGGAAAGGAAQGSGQQGSGQQWGQQGSGHQDSGQQWGQQGSGHQGSGQQQWGQGGQQGWGQAGQSQDPYAQHNPYGQQNPYAGQTGQRPYTTGVAGPVTTTPDGQPLAGWGARLGARIIDGILLGLVLGIAAIYVAGQTVSLAAQRELEQIIDRLDELQRQSPTGTFTEAQNEELVQLLGDMIGLLTPFFLTVVAIMLIGQLLYEAMMVQFAGGTVGKLIVGIRVRPRDAQGKLSFGRSLGRAATWYIAGLIPFFAIVNGLWPLWDSKRQSLNDKVAASNVVKVR